LHSVGEVQSGPTFQRALPDKRDAPATFEQDPDGTLIIHDIAADLLAPEIGPRRRPFEQMAIMLMPETAMYEDYCPVAGKDEIGFTGQMLCVKAIAQTGSMQCLADQQFGFCMAAFDGSHIPAAGRGIVNVGHTSGSFAPARRLSQCLNMRLHEPGDRLKDRHGH